MSKNKTKVSAKAVSPRVQTEQTEKSANTIVPSVGIDFGNYRVSAATFRGESHEIIVNTDGDRHTVSVVGFNDAGVSIGLPAKSAAARNASNTIHSIRSLLGVKHQDVSLKNVEFTVSADDEGYSAYEVTVGGNVKKPTPSELATLFFSELRVHAEGFYSDKVNNCVLTIPPQFTDKQKKVLINAVQKSGLQVISTIAEPLASAISFDLDKIDLACSTKRILVVDIGQYQTVLSIVSSKNGLLNLDTFEVIENFGGSRFDDVLYEHFVSVFKRETGLDLTDSKRAVLRLHAAVESVKKTLSNTEQAGVQLDGLYQGIDLFSEITRARFNMLSSSLFSSFTKTLNEFTQKNDADSISHVILSGGSSSIQKFTQIIENNLEHAEVLKHTHPDETAAYGAAKQGYYISNISESQKGKKNEEITKSGIALQKQTDPSIHSVVYLPHFTAPVSALASDFYASTGNGQLIKIFPENSCIPSDSFHKFALPSTDAKISIFRHEGNDAVEVAAFAIPAVAGKTGVSVKFSITSNNEITASVAYTNKLENFLPKSTDYKPLQCGVPSSPVTISLTNAQKLEKITQIQELISKFEAWKVFNADLLKQRANVYLAAYIEKVEAAIATANKTVSLKTQFNAKDIDNMSLSTQALTSLPSVSTLDTLYITVVEAIEELLQARIDGPTNNASVDIDDDALDLGMDYDDDDEDDDDDDIDLLGGGLD